jgi:hypothetical protein
MPVWWRAFMLVLGLLPVVAGLVLSARLHDWSMLPLLVVFAAVTVPVTGWILVSTGVTATRDRVIIGTPFRRTAVEWPDICQIEWVGSKVWLRTPDGWFLLPVAGLTRPVGRRAAPIAQHLSESWFRHRGVDWHPRAPAPWTPPVDLRGRVVLRHPIGPKAYAICMVILLASTQVAMRAVYPLSNMDVATEILSRSALAGAVLVALIAHQAWARTTIDDEWVVVRSLTGTTHIPRVLAVAVREEPTRKRMRRLVIDQLSPPGPDGLATLRSARLPVVTGQDWFSNDPEFDRTWTWLLDHVVAPEEQERPEPGRTVADDPAWW